MGPGPKNASLWLWGEEEQLKDGELDREELRLGRAISGRDYVELIRKLKKTK